MGLWTSICLYDKPELFGKAKRRTDTSDTVTNSIFEEYFQKMIQDDSSSWKPLNDC